MPRARQKRIAQVGSQWASVEANAQAIDIIKSGKLGQVTLIDGRMHRNTPTGAWYYPVPPDASPRDDRLGAVHRPGAAAPVRRRPLLPVAPVLGLLGRPADRPVRPHDHRDPHAHGREDGQSRHGHGRHQPFKNREVPDQMSAIVDYPDFTLTLTSTATNNHPYPLLTIMGTEGTLEYHGSKLVYHSEPDTRELHVLHQRMAEGHAREVRRAARCRSRDHAAEGDGDDEEAGAAGDRGAGPRLDGAAPREVLRQRSHAATEPFENAEMGHLCATVGHMVNLSYRSHREMRWDAEKRRVVEGGTATPDRPAMTATR